MGRRRVAIAVNHAGGRVAFLNARYLLPFASNAHIRSAKNLLKRVGVWVFKPIQMPIQKHLNGNKKRITFARNKI
jgi:hypothetical protein